jgi:hypothetical protein
LRLISYLSLEERQQLFDDLVALATVGHADIVLCRQAILSLPRDWVVANIENVAEPFLKSGTYEEYRRLLELYSILHPDLAQKLAARAASNTDPDIREAGEDFINLSKKENRQ